MTPAHKTREQGELDATELIQLLAAKRDQCRALRGLVDQQRQAITGDKPERLLEVLSRRKVILNRLGELAQSLRPYQAEWADVRRRLPEDVRQQVDALVNEINAVLGDILRADEEDTKMLSARKSSTAQQLSSLNAGRKVGSAYAASENAGASQAEWTDE
jgi:flagellar biosynthesis/type III secretory pathway chaperone